MDVRPGSSRRSGLINALLRLVAVAAVLGSVFVGHARASASTCGNSVVNGSLNAVAAVSASDAWAVGWTSSGSRSASTLTERWDGSAWCIVPSPDPGGAATPSDALYGVAATSASDAWAVGYYQAATGVDRTIILHWDGAAWTTVPSPNPGGPNESNLLVAVSAQSPSSAWAVGYYSTPRGTQALIAHWDGTSWKQVPGPRAELLAVAARPAGTWAVGLCNCRRGSVTERWNGTAWTSVPPPTSGSLSGVALTSSANAWAVGGYWNGFTDLTTILHWNGAAWVRKESPNRGTNDSLCGVAVTSRANAWAVGSFFADFVRYEGNGAVSFIHVKAATSASPNRPVKVTSFEVVTSQATKNLPYLNIETLIDKLSNPGTPAPACWYNGTRIADRTELIEYLKERPAQAPWGIIIIQPQMTKRRYEHVAALPNSVERTRLKLLETMLNSARGTVTGLGADLEIIGSL